MRLGLFHVLAYTLSLSAGHRPVSHQLSSVGREIQSAGSTSSTGSVSTTASSSTVATSEVPDEVLSLATGVAMGEGEGEAGRDLATGGPLSDLPGLASQDLPMNAVIVGRQDLANFDPRVNTASSSSSGKSDVRFQLEVMQ